MTPKSSMDDESMAIANVHHVDGVAAINLP